MAKMFGFELLNNPKRGCFALLVNLPLSYFQRVSGSPVKRVRLKASIFILSVFILFITACAENNTAYQQPPGDQEIIFAKGSGTDEHLESDKDPETEMAEPNQSKPENGLNMSAQNQPPTANTPGVQYKSFTMITHVNEVSREAFVQRFGQEYISTDPVLANAERIAEVELNSVLFSPDQLSGHNTFHLELFDGILKQIKVKTFLPAATGFSLQGGLEESPAAVFFLAVTEEQALGTLRLPDINTVYSIKYIYPAGRHYLFKGLITEVERYECEVKIPQMPDSID